ncbi:MAG: hypothetical protein IPP77_02260 [Bacteroidetes bacterium]|nr:hypothetical protein [Bacteroidota bacterium]
MKERLLNAFRNWNPEIELTVKVRFIQKGEDTPLTGSQYTVRLYDKDLFTDDDYLGSSQLNERGEAHIHFHPADLREGSLGFDELPDLYVLLFKGNVVHFQSKVWDNVDFDKLGLLDLKEGEVLHFGTFLVD